MKHVKMFVVVCGLAATASVASAGVALPQGWDMTVVPTDYTAGAGWSAAANPSTWTWSSREGPNGSPIFRIVGADTYDGIGIAFDIEFDQDPFVSNSFTLTNNTGVNNTFTVMVTIPIFPPLSAPTSMTGSVSGTVGDGDGMLDSFGNGATVTTAGAAPYYEALVDGGGVRQLYSAPQLHAAPLNLTASIPTQNFINEVGPAANATIGIRNVFTLTNGDNASFTSTFIIVPAPAAAAMFGVFGVVASRRRR